jgi:hypothetical protein
MSVKVGDEVLLEQAWEDKAGHYHDEYVTVARVLPDGRFTLRIGHWKTRTAREQIIQAWLNKFDWLTEDYEPLAGHP